MKLLENMKIKDLYFGDIEGKNEFTTDDRKRIKETYLNIDNIDKRFLVNDKYYIYGHKGTGKTSLLKYIEAKLKEEEVITLTILFKDIKQDILIYSKFKRLLADVSDKDGAAKAFWQWFLLSLVIEEIFPDYQEKSDLIFYTKNGLFYSLANFLTQIIKGFTLKYSAEDISIDIEGEVTKDEIDNLISAGTKIRTLELFIKQKLNKKFYILIDELETSNISSAYQEDAILIKNLILTVDKLNSLSSDIKIITAIRTEVLKSVFTSGEEINKLLESKGEEIKWTYNTYNINHPLIQMIIKKMRYSMSLYAKSKNEILDVKLALDQDIFERWFPTQLLLGRGTNNSKTLLHNTWIKPRDLIRFFNIMQRHAKTSLFFTKNTYEDTVKEYSQKAWTEIKEELITIIEDKEIEIIEEVFSNYNKFFYYAGVIKEFQANSSLLEDRIKEIIDILYNIGFIGNNYMNSDGKIVYKYSYRGEMYMDEKERLEVHRGLWKVFSLKDDKSLYQHKEVNSKKLENDFHSKLKKYR